MKRVISALSSILVIVFLMAMAPVVALADTTNVEAVQITAGQRSDDWARFQFKLEQPLESGDEITFYIKPHTTISRIRYRNYSDGYAFTDEALGAGKNTVSLGDGWYAVRVTVEKFQDETGLPDESFSGEASYITLTVNIQPGDTVYIRDFTVNGTTKTNAELAAMIKTTNKPAITVTQTAMDVENNALSYTWPEEEPEVFTPPEFSGTLPTYDKTPYTWKVNAALGGAQNLPATNLDATGKYSNITNVNDELIAALSTTTFVDPNNIIFIISDGMGRNGMAVSEQFAGTLIMNQMPYHGLSSTLSRSGTGQTFGTTDSAAGATALSSGYKTQNAYEGIDVYQKDIPQITEALRQKMGKIIGVVTNYTAYDATPACFGGSHEIRGNDSEIVRDMMSFAPDLWIGSNIANYTSTFNSLKQTTLQGQDIQLSVSWNSGIAAKNDKLWISVGGFYASTEPTSTSKPTISKAMAFSLTWLQKKSDANDNVGFFLMFENGQTDGGGHNNELDTVINEVQATDEAVAVALKFACENPDTFVLVTADHETGGLVLKDGWETNINKCVFTTTGHSQQLVAIRTIGKYGELFDQQTLHNCQVPMIVTRVLGISNFGDPDSKYSVDDILAGVKVDDLGEMQTSTNNLAGQILHIRADQAMSTMKITMKGLNIKSGNMVALAIKVPAGVTGIKLTAPNGTVLLEQKLNKALNYNSKDDSYWLSFKSPAAAKDLIIEVTGSLKANDEIWIDNVEVGVSKITFDGYDASKTTASSKSTVMVYTEQNLPAATPTPKPTATPKPTSTPEPTATPEVTATPEATPAVEPTATPEPTPTVAPETTETPVPTGEATATPTPKPTATATPEETPNPSTTPKPQPNPGPGWVMIAIGGVLLVGAGVLCFFLVRKKNK